MPRRLPTIEQIFTQYRSKVYGLALTLARNEKDAEDIVQNAFMKIMKNLDGFRGKSRLSTWIYRIVYNEALMQLRKRHRQVSLSDSLEHRIPATAVAGYSR